jgi:hypothetical protein
MVRLAGIEPTTPWFVAKYSIQLSYSRPSPLLYETFAKTKRPVGIFEGTRDDAAEKKNGPESLLSHCSSIYGAAGRNRTHDPLVRSQVLYPAELQPPEARIIAALLRFDNTRQLTCFYPGIIDEIF